MTVGCVVIFIYIEPVTGVRLNLEFHPGFSGDALFGENKCIKIDGQIMLLSVNGECENLICVVDCNLRIDISL